MLPSPLTPGPDAGPPGCMEAGAWSRGRVWEQARGRSCSRCLSELGHHGPQVGGLPVLRGDPRSSQVGQRDCAWGPRGLRQLEPLGAAKFQAFKTPLLHTMMFWKRWNLYVKLDNNVFHVLEGPLCESPLCESLPLKEPLKTLNYHV